MDDETEKIKSYFQKEIRIHKLLFYVNVRYPLFYSL